MKVLHIITSLEVGGAEKLLIDSIPFYKNAGIDLDIISLKNIRTPFTLIAEERSGNKVIGITGGSVYNPFLVFKLIKHFKHYDIIHAHLFPVLYWVVFAKIISFSSVRLIFTEHSTTNNRRNNWVFKIFDRFVYRFVDVIICISLSTKSNLVQHLNYVPNRIDVIYNGVDLKSIVTEGVCAPIRQSLGIDPGDTVLIQIASFRKAKDQLTVLRALSILPENIKCIFLGDGDSLVSNKKEAESLGLLSRVYFEGNVSNVKDYLSVSDIVVVSSKYEGFGIAAVEGMANSKPIIATNVSGLSEIVEGVGLLFEVGDYRTLANHILDLVNNPPMTANISNAGLIKSREFSINKMVNSYVKIYNQNKEK